MGKIIYTGGGKKVIGAKLDTQDWSQALNPYTQQIEGFNRTIDLKDSTIVQRRAGQSVTAQRIAVTQNNAFKGPVSFVSKTPATCSVDETGKVAWESNGACSISVRAMAAWRDVAIPTMNGPSTTFDYAEWKTGTLGEHVLAVIRKMVDGKTAGATTQNMFTAASGGTAAPAYTRNSSLFSGAFDLTAVTVVTDLTGTAQFPSVLISPRHILGGHAGIGNNGSKVVFRDGAGNYQTRTITSQTYLGDSVRHTVGLLDTAVTTITPAQLPPAEMPLHLPSQRTPYNQSQWTIVTALPMLNIRWTGGNWLRIMNMAGLSQFDTPPKEFSLGIEMSPRPDLASWSSTIQGGDSNGPVFIPVNGAMVLLHCLYSTTGGAFLGSWLTQVDAAMAALGGGGVVTTKANLSGFSIYP